MGEQGLIQLFLDGLEKWADGNLTEFNKITAESSTCLGITLCNSIDWLENRFADKELENPLNVHQQFTLAGKVNRTQDCITKHVVTRPREVIAQHF